MSELLPCPFCGEEAKAVFRGAPEEWISCTRCDAAGPMKSNLVLATAAWNRRAPSAEETRLRAEVASLRAALGQQPATEGAEPVGCPIPGMCAAVAAHAAAYRAGAEAMRERARMIAEIQALRFDADAGECKTARAEAECLASAETAGQIAAAIRALPLPAAPEGEG